MSDEPQRLRDHEQHRRRGRAAVLALVLLGLIAALGWPARSSTAEVAWADVIAPLEPGSELAAGYVLAPGHRGAEHDVVFVARRPATADRPAASVEIHVLERGQWSGVIETASFSIGYELGRSNGPRDELAAVTTALAEAIARNDAGGLGPPDAIPFEADAELPTIARVLARFGEGARGYALALGLAGLCLTLARVDRRGIALGVALTGLALGLRAVALDVPFVHDQDVQRAISGTISLRGHLGGESLHDRHPPLYFLVLHFVERIGQSEALLRAPAVVAGASLPALMIAIAGRGKPRVDDFSALAALIVATAPPLIAKSREVSELPLFAAIVMLMCATSLWASEAERPSRRLAIAVAVVHGLALWTYYLAPFAIAFELLALAVLARGQLRSLVAKLWRPLAIGVVLGSPAIYFAARIFVRDRGARLAAEARPELAWGEWSPTSMAGAMLDVAVACMGSLVLLMVLGAIGVAVQHRERAALTFVIVGLGTALSIALLTRVARVQPYYLLCAIPVVLLAVRAHAELAEGYRAIAAGALALGVAAQLVAVMPGLAHTYRAPREAFVAAFAPVIAARPEQLIVTVSHYDTTLLAYYLAREAGVPLTRAGMIQAEDRVRVDGLDVELYPLIRSHGLDEGFEREAMQALSDETWRSVLVLSRDDFHVEAVAQFLSHCELLRDAAGGQLHRCGPPPGE